MAHKYDDAPSQHHSITAQEFEDRGMLRGKRLPHSAFEARCVSNRPALHVSTKARVAREKTFEHTTACTTSILLLLRCRLGF